MENGTDYVRQLEKENVELKAALRRLRAEDRDRARQLEEVARQLMRKGQ